MCTYLKDELRTELKEKVRWKIKRDSPEEKLKDFLKWMKSIKKTTDHQVASVAVFLSSVFVTNNKKNHIRMTCKRKQY